MSGKDSPPFLSIIVPAYNEASRIEGTLEQIATYLHSRPFSAELLVVDDGSFDDTARRVEEMARPDGCIRLLRTPHRGKGHAVKSGMAAARGERRFFCDADLSMPIAELDRFLDPSLSQFDVVIGSREAEGAHRVGEPRLRHFLGRAYNLLARLLVRDIKDTQCGFKLFRAAAAEQLFALQRLDGFGFDVEVLFLAQRRGWRLKELGVDWYYMPQSKVRPLRDSLRVFRETLQVWLNHRRGLYGP